MTNISQYDIELTANTCGVCASKRAFNIASLYYPKSVLELCVGPSLPVLAHHYRDYNILTTGNDIDKKYLKQSPINILIGDCFSINYNPYDVVVFAPPLSKGCSGKREDSLSINQVTPSYYDFIKLRKEKAVLVLPGRSKATKQDREQYYKLITQLYYHNINFIVVPLINKVVKYYDVYLI
jgi:hypothetical protein